MTSTLQEVLENGSSVTYGIVQTGDDVEDGIPVFRPIDIASGRIPKKTDLKKTEKTISDQYKRTLLRGYELLITVRGSVGETFLINSEFAGCNAGRNIVPLRFDTSIVSYKFMQQLFGNVSIQRWLRGKTKGIALQGLNMGEFKEMPVIIPPNEQQKQFASFVEQVDKSKVVVQTFAKIALSYRQSKQEEKL